MDWPDCQHSAPVPVLRPSAQCPCPCLQTVSKVSLSLPSDRQHSVPSLSSDRQHSAPVPVLRPSVQCPCPCPQTVSTVSLSLSSDRQHSVPVPVPVLRLSAQCPCSRQLCSSAETYTPLTVKTKIFGQCTFWCCAAKQLYSPPSDICQIQSSHASFRTVQFAATNPSYIHFVQPCVHTGKCGMGGIQYFVYMCISLHFMYIFLLIWQCTEYSPLFVRYCSIELTAIIIITILLLNLSQDINSNATHMQLLIYQNIFLFFLKDKDSFTTANKLLFSVQAFTFFEMYIQLTKILDNSQHCNIDDAHFR